MADRNLIKERIVLSQDPGRRDAAGRRAHRGRRIAAVGQACRPTAPRSSMPRATSSSRGSSTPIGTPGRPRSGRARRTTTSSSTSAASSTSSRPSTAPRTSRGQPVGRARVHQRGHHDARRLVAHHEHARPCRCAPSRASRTPASGRCSRSASQHVAPDVVVRAGLHGQRRDHRWRPARGGSAGRLSDDDALVTMAPRHAGHQLLQAGRGPLRVGAGEGAGHQHHGPRGHGPLRLHQGPADRTARHGPAVPQHDLYPLLAPDRRGVAAGARLGRQRLARAADRAPDGPWLGARPEGRSRWASRSG